MKARPQTAKVKNEDENVFYRRQGHNDKGGFNSTNRDPNNKSRETLQEGGEPEAVDNHSVLRNERMVKTIANDGQGRSFKRHRSQAGDGEEPPEYQERQQPEEEDEPDYKEKLKIFQSESRFDDYNYSQYGDANADVISRPSRPQ